MLPGSFARPVHGGRAIGRAAGRGEV